MLAATVRLLFWAIVFIIGRLLIKKSGHANYKNKAILAATVIILGSVSFYVPVERNILTFHSVESAFKYSNFGEIAMIINGEHSDLVVWEHEKGTVSVIPKTDKGWKMSVVPKDIKLRIHNQMSIHVCKDVYSNDYYIMLHDMSNKISAVSDNKNSIFYYADTTKNINGDVARTYYAYAYLQDFDDSYSLNVDGDEFVLDECKGLK